MKSKCLQSVWNFSSLLCDLRRWFWAPGRLQAAATELAKSTLDKLRARGLKESFVADPAQLKKRVFEVLASDLKVSLNEL